MNKKVRKILLAAMLAVFLTSTSLLLQQFFDNAGGEAAYGDALAAALGDGAETKVPLAPVPQPIAVQEDEGPIWIPAPVEEDDPELEKLAAIDLAALRETNPDVIGWICIPNSRINYPLLQGEDNDYYLNHAWDHRNTSVGSIFLEQNNSADLMDYNTIVYGHNMNDGSMFAGLRKFSTQGYWEKHPHVYIVTDAGIYRYDIFAAYKAPVDSATYGLSFHQVETKAAFLLHALENSKIQTEIIPEAQDRILTLSTCSGAGYSTRWVVQARLRMVEAER